MKTSALIRSHSLTSTLMRGTALAGLTALAATSAQAQNENVVVTGTTIRGQQPVGANVISVDRTAIEATGAQTTAQLLVTIPQLDNFGSAAQGGQNSFDASQTQAPTIHSLGSSASNATLILIDGHRIPLTGISHNLIDPSIIPASALANVEVLPDGASAIYGSDAVAGVINFHTRRDYSGWETGVQYGIADSYNSFNFHQMFGHSWEDGGLVAAYNYSSRSELMNRDRDFITARQDLRRGVLTDTSQFVGIPDASYYDHLQTVAPNGEAVPYPSDGGNFQNFNCPVATIGNSPSSSQPVYSYPYTSGDIHYRRTSPSSGPGTGICDQLDVGTALPSEVRNSAIFSMYQAISDRLVLNLNAIYSSRLNSQHNSRGTISNAAAFNPAGTGGPVFGMGQTNPFYVGVPGAASDANVEYVNISFDSMLADQGIGFASRKTGSIGGFVTAGLDYDIGGDWLVSVGGTVGRDDSFRHDEGLLNSAEAYLALNGTTQTRGTPTSSVIADPYGLGTVVGVTRTLTTQNALDVWSPNGGSTSAAVLRSLVDRNETRDSINGFQNLTLHADGPLLDLFGAGPIKAAIGGEYIHYTQDQRYFRYGGGGPSSTTARSLDIHSNRTVYAAYAELVVPVISPDMEIPAVQRLTLDFAGRYDHYNDFGGTKNPKIAMNWDIVDGLRASASFGTSFTAPALDSFGQPGTGITAETGVGAGNTGASNGLIIPFNDTRPFNNGAGIAGTIVSNAFACEAAGSQPLDASGANVTAASGNAVACKWSTSDSPGMRFGGGNANLKPELGQSYSANLVFEFGRFFDALDGLTTQLTYYQAKFTGAITTLHVTTTQTDPGFPNLTTFGPANGCVDATSLCGAGQANETGWAQTDPIVQNIITGRPLSSPLPTRIYSIGDGTQQNAFDIWQNGIDFKVDYRYTTDNMGDFTFSLSGNQILRASQRMHATTGPVLEVLNNTNGSRYPSTELTARASLNWHLEPYTVGIALNYQHPTHGGFRRAPFPYNLDGANGRFKNYEHIGALEVWDLNLGYNLPDEWWSGTRLSIAVRNVFDTDPVFSNSTSGSAKGSSIGRQIRIGLTKTW